MQIEMLNIFLLIASPFIGSFLGLLCDRVPRGESWTRGRSKCRACGRKLDVRDLVPLVSYLVLKGRCRTCNAPIGISAPLIEVLALAIALLPITMAPPNLMALATILGWSLLSLSVIDMRSLRLPDPLVGLVAVTGLMAIAIRNFTLLSVHLIT